MDFGRCLSVSFSFLISFSSSFQPCVIATTNSNEAVFSRWTICPINCVPGVWVSRLGGDCPRDLQDNNRWGRGGTIQQLGRQRNDTSCAVLFPPPHLAHLLRVPSHLLPPPLREEQHTSMCIRCGLIICLIYCNQHPACQGLSEHWAKEGKSHTHTHTFIYLSILALSLFSLDLVYLACY